MRTRLTHSKWLYLAVVLLFSFSLTACDVITAATHIVRQNLKINQSTSTAPVPTLPDETKSAAPPPSGPILERGLEDTPISLIDDRLFVQMPAGAQDAARRQGIMGAEYSSHEETRLVLEGGGHQLVVYAQETFYYSENERDDIGKLLKYRNGAAYTYTTERIQDSDGGFRLIKVIPDSIDTSVNAVIIREAVAITDDDTMIYIGVFATPETAADEELCIRQADRILETIRPGTRKINASAHEEKFAGRLSIKLDKGYVMIEQPGSDFTVYYITKVASFEESIPSVGIYIGGHPTLIYPGRGIDADQLTTTGDTILKERVEWWSYKDYPYDENYSAETAFDLPHSDMLMHIFIDAADEAQFMELREMIKTVRFD